MHIFQVLESSTNASVPFSQTWRRNLYEPLLDLGHDVTLFSSEPGRLAMQKNHAGLRQRFGEQLLSAFLRTIQTKSVDLVFTYLMDGMLEAEILAEIRRHGIPMVNFSCNNIHQFDLVDDLSPYYDLNLYSEKEAGEKFNKIGAAALWWPLASNPRYVFPMDVPRTIQASFVGANYALRAAYLKMLLENQVDVQVYGPYWLLDENQPWKTLLRKGAYQCRAWFASNPEQQKTEIARLTQYQQHLYLLKYYAKHFHSPITDEELIALYSRSIISLGFLEVYDQHDPGKAILQHLHLREFEAPMAGALYCTGYSDELAEMFEPDKEVLTYRSEEELLEKIRYFTNHPVEAERIRQAGRKRALAQHTVQQRFQTLFQYLKLETHARH